jgi:hypothetical protein
MKYAVGNDKLGKNCLIVSRPVGLTCPSDCFFLHNGCYAEFTEKRFPNARKAAEQNIVVSYKDIIGVIEKAIEKNKSIRFNERGDLGLNDKPDLEYIGSIKKAIKELRKENKELPKMWVYSHFYDKAISSLSNYGIYVYASVHNKDDLIKAKKAGFKLFAWCSDIKRKKGSNESIPKLYVIENEKFITCPEQRRGRDEITCTGDKDSIACNLCVKGLANVLFLNH